MTNTSKSRRAALVGLSLCSVLALTFQIGHGQALTASDFVPDPRTATLVGATDDWLVWATGSVVKGTEFKHVQTYTYRYYLQRAPGEVAQFVCERRAIRGEQGILAVLGDGTLVFGRGGVGPYGLLLIKRGGAATEVPLPKRPRLFGEFDPAPWEAYDDGVLVRAYDFNGAQPVYFVPWSSGRLDFDRSFLLTDKTGVKGYFHTSLLRHKDTVVWNTPGKVHAFDLNSRKRRDYSLGALGDDDCKITDCDPIAFDGETLIVDRGGRAAIDIRTGEQLPAAVEAHRTIAVKNRTAYVIRHKEGSYKEGKYQYELVARRLDSAEEQEQWLVDLVGLEYDSRESLTYLARKDALLVWVGKEWKRIEW